MAQRLARDAPAFLPRAMSLPLAMNLLVQPTFQSAELTDTEVGIEIAEVRAGLLHELGRVEIAESPSQATA